MADKQVQEQGEMKRKRGEDAGEANEEERERKRKCLETASGLMRRASEKDAEAARLLVRAAEESPMTLASEGPVGDKCVLLILYNEDHIMTSYEIPAGRLTAEEIEALDTLVEYRCAFIPQYVRDNEREDKRWAELLLNYLLGQLSDTSVHEDKEAYMKVRPARYRNLRAPYFCKLPKWEKEYRDIVRGNYGAVYFLHTFE